MVLTTAQNTIIHYNTIAHNGIRSSAKTLEVIREQTRKVVDRLLQGPGAHPPPTLAIRIFCPSVGYSR